MINPSSKLKNILEKISLYDPDCRTGLKEIKKMAREIEDSQLQEQIGIPDLALLIFVLNIKYGGKIFVRPVSESDCVIYARSRIPAVRFAIANISYFPVEIHFIKLKDRHINIEGNFVSSAVFEKHLSFYICINGVFEKLETFQIGRDSFLGEHKYEIKPGFLHDLELEEIDYEISFYQKYDDNFCRVGKINSLRFAPVADVLKKQYAYMDGRILFIENGTIHCCRANEHIAGEYETEFRQVLFSCGLPRAEGAAELRRKFFDAKKKKTKQIWLFMDRVNRADDNGEVLYKYARENCHADCYFIIQQNTDDYRRLKNTGGVVALNSEKHYLLFLLADYIFTSQANGLAENPFRDDAEYFRDLYHNPKTVFLQHGITKDDQTAAFNRFNTNFTGFIVSAEKEKDSIIHGNYFYDEKQVWLTGMPRFDRLYNDSKKIILIAPSWRKGLMEQRWDEPSESYIWQAKEGFEESGYVREWSSILNNKKIHSICEEYGYRLIFMPHALAEPYSKIFIPENADIICWGNSKPYREAFAEGSLLVTDYSSVAFDFAYLRKPVLYYQFDRTEFYASHTYKKGYFDYLTDAFGEIAFSSKRLIELIAEYLKDECRLKERYRHRIDEFFEFDDSLSCERICRKIISEENRRIREKN